jgi:hypothetical protein
MKDESGEMNCRMGKVGKSIGTPKHDSVTNKTAHLDGRDPCKYHDGTDTDKV